LKIHLSTATINSHENRNKSMNLNFHPVVMFENSWPFPLDHLRDIKWSVEAEQVGSHSFEVTVSVDSPFEIENDRNYIEFHLTKKGVYFQHDDYPCRILFSAILDCPHTSPIEINEVFWGVVKTTWSKGLQ
jgi:hypothetical protein